MANYDQQNIAERNYLAEQNYELINMPHNEQRIMLANKLINDTRGKCSVCSSNYLSVNTNFCDDLCDIDTRQKVFDF